MQLAPGGFLIPLGYSHIEKGKHLAFSQIWGVISTIWRIARSGMSQDFENMWDVVSYNEV